MAKSFSGPTAWLDLAGEFRRIKRDLIPRAKYEILEGIGLATVKEIKEELLGRITPLGQSGPFAAWEPLKDATIEQKARMGLGKDGDPRSMLYATGELAQSIESVVLFGRSSVVIGTNNPYARFLEYGTIHMAPRSFLGAGLWRTMPKIKRRAERTLYQALCGNIPRWI